MNVLKNKKLKHSFVLCACLCTSVLNAQEQSSQKLEDVLVIGEKEAQFIYNKVEKTSKDLEKAQVNDIRDLTRYDPGISVNEQGQGGSAGYSMRGVDRNRVAISVDGMSQGQVFSPNSNLNVSGNYGGTINEIEYENIKQVKVSKGANSVESGSGALGGAVIFKTKDANDIIKQGQNYGVDLKTGYQSKSERNINSIAVAGKNNGLSGMFIFTRRTGQELKSHDDTRSQTMQYWYSPDNGNALEHGLDRVDVKRYESTYDAKNVWGPTREVANPLKYNSNSILSKFGYDFNDEHYAGVVLEYTKQKYYMWDLSKPAFRTSAKPNDTKWESVVGVGTYKWMRSYFQDNIHTKKRYGVEYKFNNSSDDGLIDMAHVSYDLQEIDMQNIYSMRGCAKDASKSCWPTNLDGQQASDSFTGTTEKQHSLRANLSKNFETYDIGHDFSLYSGYERTNFGNNNQQKRKSVVYDGFFDREKNKYVPIDKTVSEQTNTSLKPVKGSHYFLALKDNISINEYFALPLGVRFDRYSFKSDNAFTYDESYNTTSWNAGVIFTPNQYIELAYNVSNAFRVPAFVELYGTEILLSPSLAKNFKPDGKTIKPEEALNHEIGLSLGSSLGYIALSAFQSDYKNLIGVKIEKGLDGLIKYTNIQDIKLYGYDVFVSANLNEIASFFPEGLSTSFAYSIVKPKDSGSDFNFDENSLTNSNYLLDTLQPARFVYGIDYEAVSGEWGVGAKLVHSKAKKADEVEGFTIHPATGEKIQKKNSFKALSESWSTLDMYAWYTFKDKITLRAGINNVFDEKYTTWESLRQTGVNGISTTSVANVQDIGIARLSAPGRNFALTLEMKF